MVVVWIKCVHISLKKRDNSLKNVYTLIHTHMHAYVQIIYHIGHMVYKE